MAESDGQAPTSSWKGAEIPRGYRDITDQIDQRGIELLNTDDEYSGPRVLFSAEPFSELASGPEGEDGPDRDWVVSDVDEQLTLFIPFQSTVKIHTIYLTSRQPAEDAEVMRPQDISFYINRANNLGFDEADDEPATFSTVVKPEDWDAKTDTAKIELRFVKFQSVSTLVIFVKEGQGSGDKTRLDRIRIIGEAGEKKSMGKLEKVGEGNE